MTGGVRDDPWWASGARPDDGLSQEEDPVDRFASARHAAPDDAGGAWWHDAAEALADAARRAAAGRDGAARPGGSSRASGGRARAGHAASGEVCSTCPVCVALRALERSRPDVVAHLSEALHHLSLAAQAFVEAQVAGTGHGDDRLQRIDLEDD